MKRLVLALALVVGCSAQAQAQAQAEIRPGVTTHFSQGWPPRLMDLARPLGVGAIRDSLHWAAIETAPGRYDFTERNSGHVQRACAAGMKVMLSIEPRNKLYDKGATAFSPTARTAFASYLLAIADRYPGCVIAVEVGNEINAKAMVAGAAAADRAASHTALLRTIHERVKPGHPGLAILGGSTNTIATGFLAKLFAAGALAYMDGVAVHPYRNDPEGVERELGRLQAAMARAGSMKPIWATEFSREFAAPADGAPFYLKMVALLESGGAANHYWYALADQQWFPTMGLVTLPGERKPAGDAFAFAAETLAPLGAARRIDHGDPTLFHFRYGADTHVVWGGRRRFTTSGTPRFHRADGSATARPAAISNEPLVIVGSPKVTFGPGEVLADSLYGFGLPPLQWFARRPARDIPLLPIDWQWTTYLGEPSMPQMQVNSGGLGPTAHTSVVVRYTADRAGPIVASYCLSPQGTTGDGVTASIARNGAVLSTAHVGPLTGNRLGKAAAEVKPGDIVELIVAPNANPAGDRMKYRFRVTRSEADAAQC